MRNSRNSPKPIREWRPERIASNLHNGNYLKHWKEPDALARKSNHPVVNVSWYAALAYCRWAGKRLPTEAEWERAARGGFTALYPWGDQSVDKARANYSGSGIGATTAVGTYPANGYGLYDMAGNVWQFVADEWQSYPATPQKNPVAGGNLFAEGTAFLDVNTRRVIRGGSWGGDPINLWVEYRDSHPPNGRRILWDFAVRGDEVGCPTLVPRTLRKGWVKESPPYHRLGRVSH